MFRKFLIAAYLTSASVALAFDNGQWNDVDPQTRQWFKSIRSPNGTPCCDIADGHRTTWRANPQTGQYEVPIDGEWIPVPPEAIVRDTGNPTGEAIVWYGYMLGKPWIRCFVPEGGA